MTQILAAWWAVVGVLCSVWSPNTFLIYLWALNPRTHALFAFASHSFFSVSPFSSGEVLTLWPTNAPASPELRLTKGSLLSHSFLLRRKGGKVDTPGREGVETAIRPRHSCNFSLWMWVVMEKIKTLFFPVPADRPVWGHPGECCLHLETFHKFLLTLIPLPKSKPYSSSTPVFMP